MPARKKIAFLASLFLLLGTFLVLGMGAVFAGYGEAGVAPTCNNEKPAKPWLYRAEAVGVGGVGLYWDKTDRAGSWTVAYGVESGKYVWGLDRFGNSDWRSIIINDLPAGTYYFVVRANNGCMPGPFSDEQVVNVGRVKRVGVATPVSYEAEEPTPTQAPGERYVPPTTRETPKITPKITPVPTKPFMPAAPMPTPAPKVGFVQRIINFFLGLFGAK